MNSIQQYYETAIKGKENVLGYSGTVKKKISQGIITEDPCIRIYVEKKVDISKLASKDVIPKTIGDLKIDVVEHGIMRGPRTAPSFSAAPQQGKHRPTPAGVSAMAAGGTACTLGFFGIDRTDGKLVIVANNHCLANENKLSPGHEILQPSPMDGGVLLRDTIGTLKRYVPLKYEEYACPYRNALLKVRKALRIFAVETNRTDGAVADCNEADILKELFQIGPTTGKRRGTLGEKMHKMGRTTGYTKDGELFDNDWYGQIQYQRGQLQFGPCGLVKGKNWIAGGDSSSAAVFQSDNKLAGINFAGSDEWGIFVHYDFFQDDTQVDLL